MRLPALAAAILSASLVLTACSGGDEEPTKDDETAAAAPAEPQIWPLTGLEAKEGTSVETEHPVLVTKIDNTAGSAPQVGLGKADMVFEEMVEGSTTRLAAFFHSRLPQEVGPVRSMRATDIGIVGPVDGQVVTSGAAQQTKDRLARADVTYYEEGTPGLSRSSSRSAPYNLMANLREVAKEAAGDAERPDDYFVFGTPEDLPEGKPATSLSADFGRHVTNWTFSNGKYANQNSFAAQGDEFRADTVLVLRVKVVDAGYSDPAGNYVPESVFDGEGDASLFHGGKVVTGTWTKKGLSGELTMTTADGEELKVPAGRTWVELLPAETGDLTFQ